MLKMAGVQLHPAVRILIGAAFLAIGLARRDATPALVIGAALIVWGIAAVIGLAGGRERDARLKGRRSR